MKKLVSEEEGDANASSDTAFESGSALAKVVAIAGFCVLVAAISAKYLPLWFKYLDTIKP